MTQQRLVAGVDCSTQATKVVICDPATGEVLREGRAPHPDATEVDPQAWWRAWQSASAGLLDGVEAISVAGQQHGMVLLDGAGEVVHPAPICGQLVGEPVVRERHGLGSGSRLGGSRADPAQLGDGET